VRGLGGFDARLGAGTATGGGEDLDIFFRILRSGNQLVCDPAAIVWHRHRADNDELLKQTSSYGMGLGAWLAKLARDPEMVKLIVKTVVPRVPDLIRQLRATSSEAAPTQDLVSYLPPGIGGRTWRSLLKGAWALRRAHESSGPLPLQVDARTGSAVHHGNCRT
jgi:hypothetical protein